MKKAIPVILFIFIGISTFAQMLKIRNQRDSVGYATNSMQMDAIIKRISQDKNSQIFPVNPSKKTAENTTFRVVICPHDDYTYAGHIYFSALKNIKAKTVIIFGVAHKVKLRNRLIFEDFDQWRSAYGNVKVSSIREQIKQGLSKEYYKVDDSIHIREHSIEAIVPFL